MKFTVAFILLVLNSAFGFGQTAEFFCDHPVHKFPKTQEGVQLKYTFEISNTGKAPLIISDYDVACTCTRHIVIGNDKRSFTCVTDLEGVFELDTFLGFGKFMYRMVTKKFRRLTKAKGGI